MSPESGEIARKFPSFRPPGRAFASDDDDESLRVATRMWRIRAAWIFNAGYPRKGRTKPRGTGKHYEGLHR